MANQGAARFYKRLVGVKCARFKPPEGSEFEYVERLSKWRLTQDEWNGALDLIAADAELGEGLPQLAVIYNFLKHAEVKAAPSAEIIWQTFDLDGLRYARKITDPSLPPPLPHGAANGRICLPSHLEWHGQIDKRRHDREQQSELEPISNLLRDFPLPETP
jgi:hypothetical protein